jgi:hypothetical protein
MNRYRITLLIVLAAIAATYYGNFLGNFFAFDDLRYLENIITGPRAIALGYNAQLRLVSNFAWVPLFWVSDGSCTGDPMAGDGAATENLSGGTSTDLCISTAFLCICSKCACRKGVRAAGIEGILPESDNYLDYRSAIVSPADGRKIV